MKMRHQSGFTVLELIVVIVLATFVAGLFWVQKTDVASRGNDTSRKQDMNSIYYYLEGVYYPQHKAYPAKLDVSALKGLDPETLKDPQGIVINEQDSDYKYEPSGCQENVCSGYRLTATLEKEAAFTKNNPSH